MRFKDNAVDKAIGARLRARREELGLSQKSVGAMLDVTYQQIQKFENGKDHLKVSQLKKLADGLKVPQSFLLNGLSEHAFSAGGAGFAETGKEFVGADAAAVAQAHDLTRSFLGIRSPEMRDAVIELARRLAAAERV